MTTFPHPFNAVEVSGSRICATDGNLVVAATLPEEVEGGIVVDATILCQFIASLSGEGIEFTIKNDGLHAYGDKKKSQAVFANAEENFDSGPMKAVVDSIEDSAWIDIEDHSSWLDQIVKCSRAASDSDDTGIFHGVHVKKTGVAYGSDGVSLVSVKLPTKMGADIVLPQELVAYLRKQYSDCLRYQLCGDAIAFDLGSSVVIANGLLGDAPNWSKVVRDEKKRCTVGIKLPDEFWSVITRHAVMQKAGVDRYEREVEISCGKSAIKVLSETSTAKVLDTIKCKASDSAISFFIDPDILSGMKQQSMLLAPDKTRAMFTDGRTYAYMVCCTVEPKRQETADEK